MPFSEYIVFADESGSPVLEGIDPDFPIFVLVMIAVHKQHYIEAIVPAMQKLKFDFCGHDQLILHERDIRRQSNSFAFLQIAPVRNSFMERLNAIMQDAEVTVSAVVIDKPKLRQRYATPWSPYHVALYLALERVLYPLLARGQMGRIQHVVFEKRGAAEDKELELEFLKIVTGQYQLGNSATDFRALEWKVLFVDKKANSSGLQLADLMARPIGLNYLRPDQPNRAFELIRAKSLALKHFP